MNKPYAGLAATPFHVRMAEHNLANAWTARGAFAVPNHFGNAGREALAAHFSAVVADITPYTRLRVHGQGAGQLLSAACGRDLETLRAGEASSVYWKNDNGGVRGRGVVGRFGETNFVLGSFEGDLEWFEAAAPRFGATVRDETMEKGLLALAGPFAPAILATAGLEEASKLEPDRHGIYAWKGLTLMVSRWGRLGGFQLSCAADDGVIVLDRILAAGKNYALALAGQEALELLYLEAGLPLAGLDYWPARSADAATPTPVSLGLEAGSAGSHVLAGVEWESAQPAPFASLFRGGEKAGNTLRSAYSPALGRVIALANLHPAHAEPGMELDLLQTEPVNGNEIRARVVALPFLTLLRPGEKSGT